jgi:hypothetical protein
MIICVFFDTKTLSQILIANMIFVLFYALDFRNFEQINIKKTKQ